MRRLTSVIGHKSEVRTGSEIAAYRGRSEVVGARLERRHWPTSDIGSQCPEPIVSPFLTRHPIAKC